MSVACSARGRRAANSSRANRMSAASCCDINITTVQQLLVTHICWTKHKRRSRLAENAAAAE